MTDKADPRVSLVEASRRALAQRLNSGTAGTLSVRHQDGILITPTGIPPHDMRADQIVEMDLHGNWSGPWRPSSEWAIHARLYQSTQAGAVVHAHPDHCVALSCLRKPIPPFHYMVAAFGGDEIPCAPYAPFGSTPLAEAVATAMGTKFAACLMANHGMVAIAQRMDEALGRAEKLEVLARQYMLALSAGEPVPLTDADLAEIQARYRSYGQQPVD